MRIAVITTFTFILTICFASCEIKYDRQGILQVMDNQLVAWNKGDLKGYMSYYWNSDSLMFIGGNRITYGYKAALENYKRAFPTKEKMGILSFDVVEIDFVHEDAALVTGKWKLTYLKSVDLDGRGGVFSLTFKKLNGKWVIVKDHTC